LAGKGGVRPTDAFIGAREVAALIRAIVIAALIDIRAHGTLVQDVAFWALAGFWVVGVAVGGACGLIAEHLAPVWLLWVGREAFCADAEVVSLAQWLALVLAVSPEARVHKLHALSIHQFIAGIAKAFEATLRVDTALRARIGYQHAVVHVLASVLVCCQLVTRLAHTRVGAWHIEVGKAEVLTEVVARLHGWCCTGALVGLQGGVAWAEAARSPSAGVASVLAAAILHAAVPSTRRLPIPARLSSTRRHRAHQL
jgi:hypothetical protein